MRLILWTLMLSISLPALASAQWVVAPHLPVERRAEMLAALRLELAGRASVLEPATDFDPEMTVSSVRASAAASGATHAIWITFPAGLLAPAEVRVLDVSRTVPAHGSTPQAWDVVDARVVAVLAGSLMDAASAPATEPTTAAVPEPLPEPVPVPVPDSEPATESEPVAESADPDAPMPFTLSVGLAFTHREAPGLETGFDAATSIAFYSRMTEWASVGLRLQLGDFGYSSIDGAMLTGMLGVPSLLVSFREPLDPLVTIELGVHAEGGLFFYGRNASEWSFGLGVGGVANLDIGEHHGISLDYTLSFFGFGDVGGHSWGAASLSYLYRFN